MNDFLHRKLFALLHATGNIKHRGAMTVSITKGRTDSVKEMSDAEVEELIANLEKMKRIPIEELRLRNCKTIIGLCYGVHMLAPHLGLVNYTDKPDYEAINSHVGKRFPGKTLNDISVDEQKEMIRYFKILKRNYDGTNK